MTSQPDSGNSVPLFPILKSDEVVEPFAGPGGWSVGARLLGFRGRIQGIEWDKDACATAVTAGHERILADVGSVDPKQFSGVDGLIESAPCPPWSMSGRRLGPLDREQVIERIDAFARGAAPANVHWNDERSALSAEPMRWAVALRPRWIALEQVPGALPLWQHIGRHLTAMGYSVTSGVLSAEQYGVPQTRRRAVLVARRDGVPATLPAPTHQKYGKPSSLPRWVSMHEAIGWGLTDRPAWTVTGGGTKTGGAEVFGNAKCRALLGGRRPTIQETAILQGFPSDYPFQGKKGSKFQQCGDAIPPLLAAAILRPLLNTQIATVAA